MAFLADIERDVARELSIRSVMSEWVSADMSDVEFLFFLYIVRRCVVAGLSKMIYYLHLMLLFY